MLFIYVRYYFCLDYMADLLLFFKMKLKRATK